MSTVTKPCVPTLSTPWKSRYQIFTINTSLLKGQQKINIWAMPPWGLQPDGEQRKITHIHYLI